MIIARFSPEEIEAHQREISRKLAIVAGLEGPSEFIIRKAAIDKPVKAHVTIYSNSDEERIAQGRKLAIVAGIL